MQIPVKSRSGTINTLACTLVSGVPSGTLNDWTLSLDGQSTGPQHDAVGTLASAITKRDLLAGKGRLAGSMEELRAGMTNRKSEWLGILTATSPEYRGGIPAGICQFRQTWANNITLIFWQSIRGCWIRAPVPCTASGLHSFTASASWQRRSAPGRFGPRPRIPLLRLLPSAVQPARHYRPAGNRPGIVSEAAERSCCREFGRLG